MPLKIMQDRYFPPSFLSLHGMKVSAIIAVDAFYNIATRPNIRDTDSRKNAILFIKKVYFHYLEKCFPLREINYVPINIIS